MVQGLGMRFNTILTECAALQTSTTIIQMMKVSKERIRIMGTK